MAQKTYEKGGKRVATSSPAEQVQLSSAGWSEVQPRKLGTASVKVRPSRRKSNGAAKVGRSTDGKFTKKSDKTN